MDGGRTPRRFGKLVASSLLASALLWQAGCAANDGLDAGATETPSVNVTTAPAGALQGVAEDGVTVYRGIPFALAPVGERRWAPPQAFPDWDGVRDATEFGPACPQPGARPGSIYYEKLGEVNEDCLSLNVWVPDGAEDAPVFVWIHGGSLVTGAGSQAMYDGAKLARETGLIVVTINYRLGVLGYLAHPGLSAESPQNISGNYGLKDQVAALKWVERNIGAFGGNPDNVTIAGESAGALSVVLLMVSPEARGLFNKAVAQSAYMVSMAPLRGTRNGHPSAEEAGVAFQEKTGAASLGELREMDADKLVSIAGRAFVPFGVIDDVWITDQMPAAFDKGEQAKVPVLAGFNEGEIRSLRFLLPPVPESDAYEAAIRASHGDLADRFLDTYPADKPEASMLATTRDAMYGWTAERLAASQTAAGQPSYFYFFDHTYPAADKLGLRAFHAMEIPYVFGTLFDIPEPWPQAPRKQSERDLMKAMMHYWASFARTGTPSAEGAPDWPAYGNDATGMVFAATPKAWPGLARARFELHETVVCRRRADGTLQWNWNVGIISPPLPPEVPECN
ncbi:carboxylesterase family protein [Henriciella mobilis]|uniref:Carboxylic ester hydrolase n=1 Tax=Henriciella mobilis TaxID=2305467 RepID=A0A399R6I4_9PROT|nr:carboxylesterase family protein [Henriciella mobilis]